MDDVRLTNATSPLHHAYNDPDLTTGACMLARINNRAFLLIGGAPPATATAPSRRVSSLSFSMPGDTAPTGTVIFTRVSIRSTNTSILGGEAARNADHTWLPRLQYDAGAPLARSTECFPFGGSWTCNIDLRSRLDISYGGLYNSARHCQP